MTNFKINDIVVCVENSNTNLILNKKYKVYCTTTDIDSRISQNYLDLLYLDSRISQNYLDLLYLDEDKTNGYFQYRFVKLKDMRKNKIKNLYNNEKI